MQTQSFSPDQPVVYAIDGVEDLDYYKALLATVGAQTVHFMKPLEGLQAFLSQPPHLLILDLDVAGPAGMAFLQLLRASPWHKTVPILACSSERATPERQQSAFEAGADGYLEKPFIEAEFMEAVTCLLEDSHPPVLPEAAPQDAAEPANPPEPEMPLLSPAPPEHASESVAQ